MHVLATTTNQLAAVLPVHGPILAATLTRHRDSLCDEVTRRLKQAFPTLCLDALRPDALRFQATTMTQTPRRLHTLIQSALLFRTLSVIEHEYRWVCGVMPQYGVRRVHMLATAGWYFNAARRVVAPDTDVRQCLEGMKLYVLATIRRIAGELAVP